MTILTASLTSDACDHLMHLRFVAWPFKILLILQVEICMFLCLLNGSLTAGSETIIDILMNAVGLIVLNDLDNVIGNIYSFNSGVDSQHEDNLMIRRDRQFGMSFSVPHILWALGYSCWFLGLGQNPHPGNVFLIIFIVQSVIFPIFIFFWYFICFSKVCKGCRQKLLGWLFDKENEAELTAMEEYVRRIENGEELYDKEEDKQYLQNYKPKETLGCDIVDTPHIRS